MSELSRDTSEMVFRATTVTTEQHISKMQSLSSNVIRFSTKDENDDSDEDIILRNRSPAYS